MLTGEGQSLGGAMIDHPDVAGVTFTGSYEVGFRHVYGKFSKEFPKPAIVERRPANRLACRQLAQHALARHGRDYPVRLECHT